MAVRHTRRRSVQSWQIIVPAGTDPITGKERQKTETVKGTKREAEQRLAEMLHEINTDTVGGG